LAPANWEFTSPGEKLFSSDHVIDAYLKGKNEGLEHAQRLVIEKLIANIDKSGKNTRRILEFLKQISINPISAFLKINSWDDFSILIILPQSDYLGDKIILAYNFISELEEEVTEEFYHLQVSFCDTEDTIDSNSIRSDGFVLKHKM